MAEKIPQKNRHTSKDSGYEKCDARFRNHEKKGHESTVSKLATWTFMASNGIILSPYYRITGERNLAV